MMKNKINNFSMMKRKKNYFNREGENNISKKMFTLRMRVLKINFKFNLTKNSQ